jgi:hypothetical protein
MPNRCGCWILPTRLDHRDVWNKLFDDGFALEISDNVWKDFSPGKKRKTTHELLKMRIPFMTQTLSKIPSWGLHSRNTRRSLLVRTSTVPW